MVLQSREDDCSNAVFREILSEAYHDSYYATVSLSQELKSLYDIREELLKYNINYVAYEVKDLSEVNRNQLPLIAQVSQLGKLHFVIVRKISGKRVWIKDPQFGCYSLSMEEFMEVYTGMALCKEHIGEKLKLDKPGFFKWYEILLYVIFGILEFASLSCLAFLTGWEDSFVETIACIMVSAIMVLGINMLNHLCIERMENQIMIPFVRLTKDSKDMKALSFLIQNKVMRLSSIISFSVICALMILMLVSNGFFFALLILLSSVFSLLRSQMEEEKNATDRYCSMKESLFISKINEEDATAEEDYVLARKRASRYLFIHMFSYVMQAVSSAIVILLDMYFTKDYSLNYFLFYFMMSFAYARCFSSLLDFLFNEGHIIKAENSLSQNLNSFLLKENE